MNSQIELQSEINRKSKRYMRLSKLGYSGIADDRLFQRKTIGYAREFGYFGTPQSNGAVAIYLRVKNLLTGNSDLACATVFTRDELLDVIGANKS